MAYAIFGNDDSSFSSKKVFGHQVTSSTLTNALYLFSDAFQFWVPRATLFPSRIGRFALRKIVQPCATKAGGRVKTLAPEPEIKLNSFTNNSKTERILARIRKCYARGQHPGMPDGGARSALTV